MTLTAIERITVPEFREMADFEEGFFYELINGEIVKRSSPSTGHQAASFNLALIFGNFVKEKKLGRCFTAPFDVAFDEENLTQPDILFVSTARAGIVTENCVEGAPDLVVEILSPGTFKADRDDKMNLYLRFGVAEYWIVDPKNRSIEVYTLESNKYQLFSFSIESGEVVSLVLPGLKVPIEQVFANG
ncbi:MAG: Uma2 family endonuclease [Saprospiraceae bacterium]